jgi:hypothetical protein
MCNYLQKIISNRILNPVCLAQKPANSHIFGILYHAIERLIDVSQPVVLKAQFLQLQRIVIYITWKDELLGCYQSLDNRFDAHCIEVWPKNCFGRLYNQPLATKPLCILTWINAVLYLIG